MGYNKKYNRKGFRPAKAFFFVLAAAGFALLVGWIVMKLWNGILPDAVGVKPLTYWQAVGLLVLTRILFGGFHFGKRHHRRSGNKWGQKWMNMDEDERAQFKSKWEDYCNRKK